MKKFLNKKIIVLIFILGLYFLIQPKIVQAGTNHNVKGFAWNNYYGWVSFNSLDCAPSGVFNGNPRECPDSGTPIDYGVNIDAEGNFSGYAWSENIGWISFQELNGFPETPNHKPKYDRETGKVTGWAKILALGNDGWLKMNSRNNNYDVTLDNITKKFFGWAWNGNDDNTGIGWVNFNCNNNDNTCSSDSNYTVETTINFVTITPPTNVSVSQTCDSGNIVATVNWTDNSNNETGFEVEYKKSSTTIWGRFCSVTANLTSCAGTIPISSASDFGNYNFRVRAVGNGEIFSAWSPNDSGTLFAVTSCVSNANLTVVNKDCDFVKLRWNSGGMVIKLERKKGNGNYLTLLESNNYSSNSYIDKLNPSAQPSDKYYYKITIDNNTSEVIEVIPCVITDPNPGED